MGKKVKCWEVLECNQQDCPAYKSKELRCWLVSGTHCRDAIQGKFLEKMEMCLACEPFEKNMDADSLEETLRVVKDQFSNFKGLVEQRDKEREGTSMELALGLSEVFEALEKISSGDPSVRIPETSKLELIAKLKHSVNLTAENLAEIVDLSHEFAIGLAEHFDVLHRVSKGDLSARVSGRSGVELLESLKKVMNETIESVSTEMTGRKLTEEALQRAHDQLEIRVEQRTTQLKQEIAERKRVEEGILLANERLEYLLSSTSAVIYASKTSGDYGAIFVSKNVAQLVGYEPEEFLENPSFWIDHIHPEDKPIVLVEVPKLLEKELHTHEYRFKCKDGKYIWVSDQLKLVKDRNGRPLEIIGFWMDITERKWAEEALAKSEEEHKRLVDSSLTGIFIHQDQKYVFVNDRFAEMHAYEPEELIGKDPATLVHPDEREALKEIASRRLKGQDVPQQYEVRRLKKDGETIWCEMMATVIEYEGRPAIMGNMIDITIRKRTEGALRDSERRFRDFLYNLGDIVYETDATGEITYVNKAAEIVAGVPRKDIIGEPFLPLFTKESRKVAVDVCQRTLNGESPEYELTLTNGRICHFKNQPRRGKNGEIIGVFGTARDVTDRKVAEQKLSIYHEKLRAMASKLSLAEEQERRRIATEVHDHIGQNLAFAKIQLGTLLESDSSSGIRTTVDEVSNLVDEAIQDTRSLISELASPILYELGFVPAVQWLTQKIGKRHHITIDFDDDGQPKPLSDDIRVLLFQAVRELLANVVKHAQADKAKVSITRNADHIQVDVSDNGIGFDPAEIGPDADQGGRFGLFSIQQRLEPLSGHMEITSKPGQGAKVTLTGPLEPPGQKDTRNIS
jgi:PAS domain S-box-containing protein